MSTVLAKAEEIARRAHEGQIEESTGDPYIRHIERVVALVEGEDAKAVAWMHDVLEDTPMTDIQLIAEGIPEHIVDSVEILTRHGPESYADYIDYIKKIGDSLAIAVKIADLRDHLRPNCPERLRPRYEKAWTELTGKPLPGTVQDSGDPGMSLFWFPDQDSK
jgi:(p)ppGpp synthase/HD superfamily hydrolase